MKELKFTKQGTTKKASGPSKPKAKSRISLNTIYNEDCIKTMRRMPDNFIDLTVTSPPYDAMRAYNGYSFDFEAIATELWRVTKEGGVVVWVVGDQTVRGSETGTSFHQALFFMSLGFRLHDTMIYLKSGFGNPSTNRYHQVFEYMFVFSKGKPTTFNPRMDRKNKYVGIIGGERSVRGEYGMRFNVWYAENGGNHNAKRGLKHPAPMPESLANDHILSWSEPGDLVFDPFGGSGTTAVQASMNARDWITSEISSSYCKIIRKHFRVAQASEIKMRKAA